ncbi:MAG: BsaWI family type II restriction enzyme [Oligoflexia bacterium]|nr:BsaWI family type II restriction enzyme [Oligoflexia bacterium]
MNTIEELIKLYEAHKKRHGKKTYRHISSILKKAKAKHKKSFKGWDHEQSWRAFKGKNFEKLVKYIIEDQIKNLNLEIVNGSKLDRTIEENLPKELVQVKRNLLIDYGEFGYHLPDIDIVIYRLKTKKVLAVVSVKVTLRERIAQTGYWKIKLNSQYFTKHIKTYFITLDEDETLRFKKPAKKGRAIAEADTHGSYVLSEKSIEESKIVKGFDKFVDDLKKILTK